MMFYQTFFGKGPEPFDTIDVDLSMFEFIPVINIKMPVSTEHKRVVATPFVSIYNGSSSDLPDSFIYQRFDLSISENTTDTFPRTHQDPEYDRLVASSTTPLNFSSSSEV
jgi:hypothetical protein